jgi:hypothetical protein
MINFRGEIAEGFMGRRSQTEITRPDLWTNDVENEVINFAALIIANYSYWK